MASLAGNARHIECRAPAHPTRSCAAREWLPSFASGLRDPATLYDAPRPLTCRERRSPESPVLRGIAVRRRPRHPLDAVVRSPGCTRRVGSASASSPARDTHARSAVLLRLQHSSHRKRKLFPTRLFSLQPATAGGRDRVHARAPVVLGRLHLGPHVSLQLQTMKGRIERAL